MNQKILIINDDKVILESLKTILSNHYNLILTMDSAQALDILKNDTSISLILIDINLPQLNGLPTISSIKEKYPDKNIIIVTGYESVGIENESLNLDADGYIVKPFNSKKILDTIKKLT